ncbi:hypothetical protein E4U17_002567 [Claviceps sp. LM77 group G4]|nr:hypothetical protein E4U17_002567 [Claviceps sp. LM77 group G4]KAG6066866.1 hypothetical protein E4U16_000187 [Claviceps sp. LM84 group G4]KAG6076777.1 hypothetical protein E4U33_001649 [Claviceps sp. LM78 group G4]
MTVELGASGRAMRWRQRSKPIHYRKLCGVSSFTTASSQALAQRTVTWSTRNSSQSQDRSMAAGIEDEIPRVRLRGAAADAESQTMDFSKADVDEPA